MSDNDEADWSSKLPAISCRRTAKTGPRSFVSGLMPSMRFTTSWRQKTGRNIADSRDRQQAP